MHKCTYEYVCTSAHIHVHVLAFALNFFSINYVELSRENKKKKQEINGKKEEEK